MLVVKLFVHPGSPPSSQCTASEAGCYPINWLRYIWGTVSMVMKGHLEGGLQWLTVCAKGSTMPQQAVHMGIQKGDLGMDLGPLIHGGSGRKRPASIV